MEEEWLNFDWPLFTGAFDLHWTNNNKWDWDSLAVEVARY
jgi:hypothetical protein